jgi:hypothetical protein
MHTVRRGLFVIVIVVVAILVAPAEAEPAQRTGEWIARMDGLAGALTALLTDATIDAPVDDDRRRRLRSEVDALRSLAHGLAAMKVTPDADPTIGFMLHELDGVIEDANRADTNALPGAALAVAWTCMGCHTRAPRGTPRPIASLAAIDATLPADVRGTALAATRRFQDALRVFRDAAFDEGLAAKESTRWVRSVKGALLLELRVNHNPRGALEVVDEVINTPGGETLWEDASAWRRALAPMVKEQRPWPRDAIALYAEADRLVADTEARAPTDPGREILALRATAIVHDLLMLDPPKDMRAQSLAWLGQSYRELRDLDIWSLHLVYDAACVEAAPHSILATECFARWSDGARSAFTGNGGGALPPDLAAREATLRDLSRAR